MSNDSATGGYLSPSSAPPLEDAALDALLQAVVVGITGLPGTMVRPRWQTTVPKLPEAGVDWCAIGIVSETPEYGAYTRHFHGDPSDPNDPDGQGYDQQIRHETLDIMASFYGPNSRGNAKLFRDGIAVAQNREAFFLQNMNFVAADCRVINTSELISEAWFRRVDLTFCVRREIDRTYPVLNILSAPITVTSDAPNTSESFSAGPNPP